MGKKKQRAPILPDEEKANRIVVEELKKLTRKLNNVSKKVGAWQEDNSQKNKKTWKYAAYQVEMLKYKIDDSFEDVDYINF